MAPLRRVISAVGFVIAFWYLLAWHPVGKWPDTGEPLYRYDMDQLDTAYRKWMDTVEWSVLSQPNKVKETVRSLRTNVCISSVNANSYSKCTAGEPKYVEDSYNTSFYALCNVTDVPIDALGINTWKYHDRRVHLPNETYSFLGDLFRTDRVGYVSTWATI